MTDRRTCSRCGAPTSDPSQPCPACLMQLALGSPPVGEATQAEAGGAGYPTIEELAPNFPELELLEPIGRGGMGVVYLARQRTLDRLVALKIIRADIADDPGFAERFAREARALARLNHPNIVTVHDFGQRGGMHYLVMEYVKGGNVRQLLRAGRLDPQAALAIVPPICDALQYAHEEGIVHRDIKPENLLVDERGRAKIADFGLAKLVKRRPADVTLTADRQALGTLHYMAPEQLDRPLEVDHRADIYSLGVTLYEMLTGELPLGRFSPPSVKSGVDERLDDVVLKTLEREPDRRYQHASDVKHDVVAYSSSVAAVPPPKLPLRAPLPPMHREQDATEERWAPGMALIFVGLSSVVVHLAAIPLLLRERDLDEFALLPLIGVVAALPMILGGILCVSARAYEAVVVSALVAMLPLSICFPISFFVGLWALIALRKRSVRAAFAEAGIRRVERPPGIAATRPVHDPSSVEEPSQEHLAPGIALAFTGMLVVFVHVAGFVALAIEVGLDEPVTYVNLGLAIFGLPMIVGGACCAKTRGYELAVVGALTALLPVSTCLPLSLPIGIWTLLVLRKRAVREAFAIESGSSPSPVRDAGESRSLAEWWRDLPRGAQLIVHVPLRLLYSLGLLCAFSFGNMSHGGGSVFAMGFPEPWLTIYEADGQYVRHLNLDVSALGVVVGLAALFAGRALRNCEGRPESSIFWHTALWSALLAVGLGIAAASLALHPGSVDEYPNKPLVGAPLLVGAVLGGAFCLASLIAAAFGRRSVAQVSPTSHAVPAKPVLVEKSSRSVGVAALVVAGVCLLSCGGLFWLGLSFVVLHRSDSVVSVRSSHQGIAREVVVSRDGRYTVSVGDDGQILWADRDEGGDWHAMKVEFDGQSGPLRSVALDPYAGVAYVASEAGGPTVACVDLRTREVEYVQVAKAASLRGLSVGRSGATLAYVANETQFGVIDIVTGQSLASADIYHGDAMEFGNVQEVAASTFGSFVAATSSNLVADSTPDSIAQSAEPCRLTMFDLEGKERLTSQLPDFAEFSHAQPAFLDDRTLALALPSGRLCVWKQEGEQWVQSSRPMAPGQWTAAAASLDGKKLWLAHERQIVAIDVETCETVAFADLAIGEKAGDRFATPIESIAAASDPLTVAVACWDGQVQIVTAATIRN